MAKSKRLAVAPWQFEHLHLGASVLLQWVAPLKRPQDRAAQAVLPVLPAFSLIEMQDPRCGRAAYQVGPVPKGRMDQGFQCQDRLNQMLKPVVRGIGRWHAILAAARPAACGATCGAIFF